MKKSPPISSPHSFSPFFKKRKGGANDGETTKEGRRRPPNPLTPVFFRRAGKWLTENNARQRLTGGSKKKQKNARAEASRKETMEAKSEPDEENTKARTAPQSRKSSIEGVKPDRIQPRHPPPLLTCPF
mmetsp:Transcript_55479/g.108634  ORF Transcript_55479/g.108634 Transcript_55479/m.108634 type:complete len:129 (-) Transcript_55479:488-874(-)